MKKLYLFDFDGTLTRQDTMFLFLRFYSRRRFRVQYVRHIPLFVLLKLRLADAGTVKRSFISSVLKGQKEQRLEEGAQRFFDHYYPQIIRRNALDFIKNIDRNTTESFIVTASLDIWVKPFAEQFQMRLIATQAEFSNGVFTGNFTTPNCNGIEKVNRIKEAIAGEKFDKKIAFGDTDSDRPMMNFANESHFRFFH